MEKTILDMCCGSRMFYFDKHDPNVLFTDIREYHDTLCDGRATRYDSRLHSLAIRR